MSDGPRSRAPRGFADRSMLARRVYNEAIEAWPSFEGEHGLQLLYVIGAILNDESASGADADFDSQVRLMFEEAFPKNHPIWKYIKEGDDADG